MKMLARPCAGNARAQVGDILTGTVGRTDGIVAGVNALVAAWGLSAINAVSFGFLADARADNSVSVAGTAATSPNTPWTAADVGKQIDIAGAGAAGAVHSCVISGFVSAGSVVLSVAAPTSTTASPTSATGLAIWGQAAALSVDTTPLLTPDGSRALSPESLDLTHLSDATVAAAGAPMQRTLAARWKDIPSVLDYGAVGDGVSDDTNAIQAAIAANYGKRLLFPAREYLCTGELVITGPITLCGESRERSTIRFQGSPTKTVRTLIVWRAEYDVGNYAVSSDAAISCGIIVQASRVVVNDLRIFAGYASVSYTTPFNSLTDYPTSGFDYGILVQRSSFSAKNVLIDGPFMKAGIAIDASQAPGSVDQCLLENVETHGHFGLRIEGAQGQPLGGSNYANLTAADVRGSGGASDFLAMGCQFYDTALRLTINGVSNKLVRRSADGGGAYIGGQLSANSAKRLQGIRFIGCRFASADPIVLDLNYCNRVEICGCHTEFRSGSYNTDGVSLMSSGDWIGVRSTVNAQNVIFIGGEKSGEADALTYKDAITGAQLVSEIGRNDPSPAGSIPAGRFLGGVQLRDRGTWTPMLTATTPGTPTYGSQVGTYARVGNLVFITGRVLLSAKTGMSGNVSISNIPFTASNLLGGTQSDSSLSFSVVSNVTLGDSGIGGLVNDGTKTISLYKFRSGLDAINLSDADITNTSLLQFSGVYLTEDP